MDNKEIELIIDKKIADAKLEVAEKRLHYVIGIAGAILTILAIFVTIFGIIGPYLVSSKNSDKVDSSLRLMRQEIKSQIDSDAINMREDSNSRMESLRADVRAEMNIQSRQIGESLSKVDQASKNLDNKFKELAGNQLKKPNIECTLDGQSLEDGSFKIIHPNHTLKIKVKNNGDAPARIVRIQLYSNYERNCQELLELPVVPNLDETQYKCSYTVNNFNNVLIDPTETQLLEIDTRPENHKIGTYPLLLKVSYSQPNPLKYHFSIIFSDK